jgi:hypothetical protein
MRNFVCNCFPIFLVFVGLACNTSNGATLKTENVFLIISDGFRWQEVFTGAEERLISKELGGVKNTNALRAEYWRTTAQERREQLLPFFWTTIASRGQLLGNQNKGSVVTVTNGKKFSYPGYNEMITGSGDPRITSNDKKPNPNTNVFEWLNMQPAFKGRIAVLGTWDAFPYIFNCERSRLPIWPAWEPKLASIEITPPQNVIDFLRDNTPIWDEMTYDSLLINTATDYLKKKKPRLAFFGFGETDEWAHAGRYDLYLASAHHFDSFVRRLWETCQSISQYKNKTTFIVSADHGRGSGPEDWKSHGEKIERSEGIWLAVMGPDTPPLGERTQSDPHTQSQIAATIAALLRADFHAAFPNSGEPIQELLGARKASGE